MRLVIDTTGMTFTVGRLRAGAGLRDQAAQGRPADRGHAGPGPADRLLQGPPGRPRSEIISVKLPDPTPVPAGTPVRPDRTGRQPLVENGRNGVAYRATAIEPAMPERKAS